MRYILVSRWSPRTGLLILVITLIVIGSLVLLWNSSYLDRLATPLRDTWALLQDREQIRRSVESWGHWAPLFFIVFQALQVVIVPIPGETSAGLVSGFVFGPWIGFLYTIIGLSLGSLLAYQVGRWLKNPLVNRLVSQESRRRLEALMQQQGALAALLIFALPYFPKDFFCIALGMSGMPIKIFLLVMILGRLPNALLFNLKGAYLYEGEYLSFFFLLGAFLALAGVVFLFRKRLSQLLERLG